MASQSKVYMVLPAVTVLLASGPAHSGMSGEKLLQLCREVYETKEPTIRAAECVGYIDGVADGWDAARDMLDPRRGNVGFCVPGGTTRGELARVVVRFIVAHSENVQAHSALLVLAALIDAYPCQ